jgi:hypothetical protein
MDLPSCRDSGKGLEFLAGFGNCLQSQAANLFAPEVGTAFAFSCQPQRRIAMFHNRMFASRFQLSAGSCHDADLLASHFRGGGGAEQLPLVEPTMVAREDQPPRRRKNSSNNSRRTPEPSGSSEGLCSNSENRLHCMMRSQEGGVWHCEEYR